MGIITWTIGSVLVVSIVALIGIFTLSLKEKLLGKILLLLVSLSAGTLFGDALLHLLPEAVEESGFTVLISLMVLSGIIIFFIVEKLIHLHTSCKPSEINEALHKKSSKHKYPLMHEPHKAHIGFMNLFGDLVHNFADGLIIAASYFISIPVAVASLLAEILH